MTPNAVKAWDVLAKVIASVSVLLLVVTASAYVDHEKRITTGETLREGRDEDMKEIKLLLRDIQSRLRELEIK